MLNEKLSAWVDGELDDTDAEQVMLKLLRQPEARRACETAVLIGDALRQEPAVSAGFSGRLMAALEQEPVVFAPAAIPSRPRVAKASENASSRWAALAASVAGVLMVGWIAMSPSEEGSRVVPASPALASNSAPSHLVNSARNDDEAYVMAHYAGATGTPVPGVAAFVRTVSSERMGATR